MCAYLEGLELQEKLWRLKSSMCNLIEILHERWKDCAKISVDLYHINPVYCSAEYIRCIYSTMKSKAIKRMI